MEQISLSEETCAQSTHFKPCQTHFPLQRGKKKEGLDAPLAGHHDSLLKLKGDIIGKRKLLSTGECYFLNCLQQFKWCTQWGNIRSPFQGRQECRAFSVYFT
jgi:hypothetical protein